MIHHHSLRPSKILGLVSLFALPLLGIGCAEDKLMLYADGDTSASTNNVYFSLKRWSGSPTYTLAFPVEDGSIYAQTWRILAPLDTIVKQYTFERPAGELDYLAAPVSLMGYVASYERPIAYEILPSSTAVEGLHYDVYKAAIPAGAITGAIMLKVYHRSVADTSLVINFRLRDNQHFQTRYYALARSATDTSKLDLLSYSLKVADMITKPEKWDSHVSMFFGTFSVRKLRLLQERFEDDVDLAEFYKETPSLSLLQSWANMLRQSLIDYPVCEDPNDDIATCIPYTF
jgi:hypothetical protein